MESKPRIEIEFCTQCRWLLRAAWLAQELLTTFEAEIGEVALIPRHGRGVRGALRRRDAVVAQTGGAVPRGQGIEAAGARRHRPGQAAGPCRHPLDGESAGFCQSFRCLAYMSGMRPRHRLMPLTRSRPRLLKASPAEALSRGHRTERKNLYDFNIHITPFHK